MARVIQESLNPLPLIWTTSCKCEICSVRYGDITTMDFISIDYTFRHNFLCLSLSSLVMFYHNFWDHFVFFLYLQLCFGYINVLRGLQSP